MIKNQEVSFSEENKTVVESLKSEIIQVFSKTQQPEKDNIAPHSCEECIGVREDFNGIKWQEASNELLERNYDNISLFSPQAFNYYLPAFLIYTLNNFDDSSSDFCQYTIYAITPGESWKNKDGSVSDGYKQHFELFTPAQMNLIYRFLALAKENPIYMAYVTSIERSFDRLKAIKAVSPLIFLSFLTI